METFAGEMHVVVVWWLDQDFLSGSTTLEQNFRGTSCYFFTTKINNQYSWSISTDFD